MELNEMIPQDVKIDIAAKIISENYEDLETWDDLHKQSFLILFLEICNAPKYSFLRTE